jgi:DNA-binding Xre family transcriptional regulator
LHDAEDWPAVVEAIRERMAKLKISTARLARETGLSETTVRYIGRTGRTHYKSNLVAISAVLGWRYDHLTNILRGETHKNTPVTRRAEERLSLIDAKLNWIMEQFDKS